MESPARQLDEEINQDNQNLKEITAMHQFAEILRELEKMTPQSQAVLDKQKAIYEYFYGPTGYDFK
ncbi:hypothetical protein PCASD_06749 [Puccinia coronata f. sp. avenae]|uniref:Uncharacterized protein n=1 Tax=Puccinia coronata f. sp. avenae TaxID=200324 RepID=A0A2N5V0F8_9BASI|nr:hypothetical protein PCASD_06749 [Puccinia coronata f. sp. avenae]